MRLFPRDSVAIILLVGSALFTVLLIVYTNDFLALIAVPVSIFAAWYTKSGRLSFPMYAYTLYGMNLVFFGLYLYRVLQYETRGRLRAIATVINVNVEESSGEDGTDYYYTPTFRFMTRTGEEVMAHYPGSSKSSSYYTIGNRFNILYKPENPRDVWIDSLWHNSVPVAVRLGLIVFGGIVSLASMLYLLGARASALGASKSMKDL